MNTLKGNTVPLFDVSSPMKPFERIEKERMNHQGCIHSLENEGTECSYCAKPHTKNISLKRMDTIDGSLMNKIVQSSTNQTILAIVGSIDTMQQYLNQSTTADERDIPNNYILKEELDQPEGEKAPECGLMDLETFSKEENHNFGRLLNKLRPENIMESEDFSSSFRINKERKTKNEQGSDGDSNSSSESSMSEHTVSDKRSINALYHNNNNQFSTSDHTACPRRFLHIKGKKNTTHKTKFFFGSFHNLSDDEDIVEMDTFLEEKGVQFVKLQRVFADMKR